MTPNNNLRKRFGLPSLPKSLTKNEHLKLYDTTFSWEPLLNAGQNFLHVLQVPLLTGSSARTLVTITDTADMAQTIKELPEQKEHTVRIFFVENFNFQDIIPIAIPPLTSPASLTSQWGCSTRRPHWEIDSYRLTINSLFKSQFESTYIDSVSIATETIRRTLKCMFQQMDNGRMIWYINAESMVQNLDLLFKPELLKNYALANPAPEDTYSYHLQLCKSLRSLIETQSNLLAQIRSESGCKQFLLLLYSQAILQDYQHQVYYLQDEYAKKKEGLSDPRRGTLTLGMLEEIIRDVCFYEEMNEKLSNLSEAIDTLLESLKVQLLDITDPREFQSLAVDLRSTCKDLKRVMRSLLATQEKHLTLAKVSRSSRETASVKLLGILASIFLPLQLAASVLSMQTRFRNLGLLIYDFFGVLFLFGILVVFTFVVVKVFMQARERLQMPLTSFWRTGILAAIYTFLIFCTFVLLAVFYFIVMLSDSPKAKKVLWYGTYPVLGLLAFPVLIHWVRGLFRSFPGQQQHEA